jgi:hypothetical protein
MLSSRDAGDSLITEIDSAITFLPYCSSEFRLGRRNLQFGIFGGSCTIIKVCTSLYHKKEGRMVDIRNLDIAAVHDAATLSFGLIETLLIDKRKYILFQRAGSN